MLPETTMELMRDEIAERNEVAGSPTISAGADELEPEVPLA